MTEKTIQDQLEYMTGRLNALEYFAVIVAGRINKPTDNRELRSLLSDYAIQVKASYNTPTPPPLAKGSEEEIHRLMANFVE